MKLNSHTKILVVIIISLSLLFTVLAFLNHYTYNTTRDMRILEEVFHNTIKGDFFFSNERSSNYLGDHFALSLIFLFPLYYLVPKTIILLALQSFAIIIGSLFIYKLSVIKLKSKKISLFVSLIYLLYPPLFHINLEEFHIIVFAIPLLLLMFLFLEKNQYKLFVLTSIIFLMIKETAFVIFIPLTIYVYIKKNKRLGLVLFLVSTVILLLIINSVMPGIATLPFKDDNSYPHLGRFSHIGESFSEIVINLVRHPSLFFEHNSFSLLIDYLKNSLKFLFFLPLASPLILIGVPFFAQNFISSVPFQRCVPGHYFSLLIPILFISFIDSLAYFFRKYHQKKSKKILTVKVLLTLSVILFVLFGIIASVFSESHMFNNPECTYRHQFLKFSSLKNMTLKDYYNIHNMRESIPSSDSIKVSHHFYPHEINKESQLFRIRNLDSWYSKYLFIDSRDITPTYVDLNRTIFVSDIEDLKIILSEKGYDLIYQKEIVYIFKKLD